MELSVLHASGILLFLHPLEVSGELLWLFFVFWLRPLKSKLLKFFRRLREVGCGFVRPERLGSGHVLVPITFKYGWHAEIDLLRSDHEWRAELSHPIIHVKGDRVTTLRSLLHALAVVSRLQGLLRSEVEVRLIALQLLNCVAHSIRAIRPVVVRLLSGERSLLEIQLFHLGLDAFLLLGDLVPVVTVELFAIVCLLLVLVNALAGPLDRLLEAGDYFLLFLYFILQFEQKCISLFLFIPNRAEVLEFGELIILILTELLGVLRRDLVLEDFAHELCRRVIFFEETDVAVHVFACDVKLLAHVLS